MAFKTLLTVTGSDLSDRDLLVAADLCDQIEAHLSVLIVALAAPPPVGEYAAMVSDVWQEQRRGGHEGTAGADDCRIKIPCEIHALQRPFQRIQGHSVDRRGDRAPSTLADLTVVGPEMLASETLKDKVIEGALFSSGKPLLLVPEGSRPTIKPSRVMIAWDSRRRGFSSCARVRWIFSPGRRKCASH